MIQGWAGDLWLTECGQNAIVRANGKSREITEWNSGQLSRFDSMSGTANRRQIHGRKGEVPAPESAAVKLVWCRFK